MRGNDLIRHAARATFPRGEGIGEMRTPKAFPLVGKVSAEGRRMRAYLLQ